MHACGWRPSAWCHLRHVPACLLTLKAAPHPSVAAAGGRSGWGSAPRRRRSSSRRSTSNQVGRGGEDIQHASQACPQDCAAAALQLLVQAAARGVHRLRQANQRRLPSLHTPPHRFLVVALPCHIIPAGETRDKKDLVYVDSEGQLKASKPVDEKLVERRREGVHAGKVGAGGGGGAGGAGRWGCGPAGVRSAVEQSARAKHTERACRKCPRALATQRRVLPALLPQNQPWFVMVDCPMAR